MNTVQNINIEEIRLKLYEKLKESGWGDKLKTFILSNDFEKILNSLVKEVSEGKRFTPPMKQIFRAFECCPLDNLKVVIIGQDPYSQVNDGINVADGIAFSCSNTMKPEASLRYMFKAIEETVYKDGYTWNPDLSRWSEQGILMLNTAFTTTVGKTGTHYDIWNPFMTFLLDYITINHPGLVYVFMGKKAQEWSDYIPDNNYKVFTSHPASASYNNLESWDCNDMFNEVFILVKKQFNEDLVW